jgi:hypothetical protein
MRYSAKEERKVNMTDMLMDKGTIFSPLDLTVLNIFLLLTSCGARMTHNSNLPSCATSLKRLEVPLPTSTPGQITGFIKTSY